MLPLLTLIGGVGVLLLCVYLFDRLINVGGRGSGELPIFLAVVGFTLLANQFSAAGVELCDDRVKLWRRSFWIVQRVKEYERPQLSKFVLGQSGGTYSVSAELKEGEIVEFPVTYKLFKDAQGMINECTERYGVSAGVDLENPQALAKAAAFAKGDAWSMKSEGTYFTKTYTFTGADGTPAGGFVVTWSFFRQTYALISGAPGEKNADWFMKAQVMGKDAVDLRPCGEGLSEGYGEPITKKRSFIGSNAQMQWTDPSGQVWSALIVCEDMDATQYTYTFYRGAPPAPGDDESNCVATAITHKEEGFRLEIADPAARTWVRLALCMLWLR